MELLKAHQWENQNKLELEGSWDSRQGFQPSHVKIGILPPAAMKTLP